MDLNALPIIIVESRAWGRTNDAEPKLWNDRVDLESFDRKNRSRSKIRFNNYKVRPLFAMRLFVEAQTVLFLLSVFSVEIINSEIIANYNILFRELIYRQLKKRIVLFY